MIFQLRHLFLALVLHGLLFALLAGGVQCSRKPPMPPVIQAVLLDPSRQEVSQRQRKEEQQRKRAEELRQKEEKKKREDQQRRAEEAEKQRKQAEAESRRKAEAQKKEEELAQKKKVEEVARKKREEQQRREKELQLKREAEAKESMEQAMQQEALQRQIDQEQRARARTEQEQAFARWQAQVSDKVRRNWIRPLSSEENFECKVLVQQLPGGQVTRAAIAESCGNSALDESVVKAVLRSDPLPSVPDPALFQREFIFVFIP
jgi:colicin import membrane protein